MSGLEALSLACNIVTLISFAHETISLCKSVYAGETPGAHLSACTTSLEDTSSAVLQDIRSLPLQRKTQAQRRLETIAEKCNEASRALQEEIKFFTVHQAKGSLTVTLRTVTRTKWRKERLARLEKSLSDCQSVLDTSFLAQLCEQSQAISLRQDQRFDRLDVHIKDIISGIAQGHIDTQQTLERTIQETCGQMLKDRANRELSFTAHVTAGISDAESSTQRHTTEVGNGVVRSVENMHITASRQATSQEERRRLLASLKYPGLNERHSTLRNASQDTFRWIFPSLREASEPNPESEDCMTRSAASWDHFEEWLKSEDQSYWVSGKPGAGKSTLMKFIVDHPKTRECLSAWRSGAIVLHYFFWKPGSVLQRSLRGLYFTLLYQLLHSETEQHDFYSMLVPQTKAYTEHSDWPTTLLRETLLTLLHEANVPVCIFLDGLDEICQEDGAHGAITLTEDLKRRSHIKLCLSSRPEPMFTRCLESFQHLRLQDLNRADMLSYADQELHFSWKAAFPELSTGRVPNSEFWGMKNYLRSWSRFSDELVNKAEGVFLWLCLAVREIRDGILLRETPDQLREKLRSLPAELTALYWDMWNRRNTNSRRDMIASARLLTLMVDFYKLIESQHLGSRHSDNGPYRNSPSILDAAMVMDADLASRLCSEKTTLEDLPDEVYFDQVILGVLSKCAGLVEIQSPRRPWSREEEEEPAKYFFQLKFPHRSAYDFLVDTEHGKSILSTVSQQQEIRAFTIVQVFLIEWGLYQRTLSHHRSEALLDAITFTSAIEEKLAPLYEPCKRPLPLSSTRWA